MKESLLPLRVDSPVDRYTLVPRLISFSTHPIVEVAPRSIPLYRCSKIIPLLLEFIMVILVEEYRFRRVPLHTPRLLNHQQYIIGVRDTVAMDQYEIRGLDNVWQRDEPPTITRPHIKPETIPATLLHQIDQFIDSSRLEYVVIVSVHIAFVVNFDEDVPVTPNVQPLQDIIYSISYRSLVLQPFILSEEKQSKDRDHAELIR